jgi:hypothetical protein
MMIFLRGLLLLVLAGLLVACESDNEHFCARYHYVYDQLLEEGMPAYGEMKQQLIENLGSPDKDHGQAKFMLFVLEDWYSGLRPEHEPSRQFCMRVKRWQAYP